MEQSDILLFLASTVFGVLCCWYTVSTIKKRHYGEETGKLAWAKSIFLFLAALGGAQLVRLLMRL